MIEFFKKRSKTHHENTDIKNVPSEKIIEDHLETQENKIENAEEIIEPVKERVDVRIIIKEIHDSFNSEVDRLLNEANIHNAKLDEDKDICARGKRLKDLGFENTKEAVLYKNNSRERYRNDQLIETINYFSMKYPNYKFITERGVNTICEKYNLILGSVCDYIGDVPDKNIDHIEKFKIDDIDKCYLSERGGYPISYKEFKSLNKDDAIKSPLEIVAPISDFNLRNKRIKNHELVDIIPDPIVLQPVYHNNKKHYLIVTAWGLEALDELVVNQKMN